MERGRFVLALKLIAVVVCSCLFANGQTGSTTTLADLVIRMNHPGLRSLLKQPGGLAQAANKAGRLVIDCRAPLSSSMDLARLASTSDVVVLGQVRDRTATVDSTANLVTTRVHLRADEVVRGRTERDFYVDIPGGGIVFGMQGFADVRFDESKAMGDGQELVLFLTNTSDENLFKLTNGIESIFFVSLSNGIVTSAATIAGGTHAVSSISVSVATLRTQILNLLASIPK